jgi:hypothetical protein
MIRGIGVRKSVSVKTYFSITNTVSLLLFHILGAELVLEGMECSLR